MGILNLSNHDLNDDDDVLQSNKPGYSDNQISNKGGGSFLFSTPKQKKIHENTPNSEKSTVVKKYKNYLTPKGSGAGVFTPNKSPEKNLKKNKKIISLNSKSEKIRIQKSNKFMENVGAEDLEVCHIYISFHNLFFIFVFL
jgi:hypothetical protein